MKLLVQQHHFKADIFQGKQEIQHYLKQLKEEEEEDPHDDADVSDCEDAPANSNDEDNGASNTIDEFDDGYWDLRDFRSVLFSFCYFCALSAALFNLLDY